jgi:hypothetical protein
MRRQLRWYGASPLHLLALLACFGLAGYAAARLVSSHPVAVAVWFLGAVIGHDLLLMPLYSLADRSAMAAIRHREPQLPATPWINYVRVPAALSGLLLLVWFPLILRLQSPYHASTTLSADPYVWHWLAVTGALFLLSASREPPSRRNGRPRHPTAPARIARPGRRPIQCSPRVTLQGPTLERESNRLPQKTKDPNWLLAKPRPAAPLPVMSSANPGPARSRRLPGKIRGRPTRPITSLPPSTTKQGRTMKPDKQSKPETATNTKRAIGSAAASAPRRDTRARRGVPRT